MSKLAELWIRDAEYVKDAESGKDVFHVTDPHALTQAAGYLIYTHSQADKENIYYRGQGRLYDGIVPTLFRGIHNKATQANRQGSLTKYIKEIRKHNKIFGSFSEVVHEPLLQHYGINTSWIDLVENIWVALWFACHKARYTGQYGHYLHFERRSSSKIGKDAFVYILLVGAEFSRMKIEDEAVTIYHSGMVQGNTPQVLITSVERVGYKGYSAIVISTSDGLKYNVPMGCFSEAD